MMAFGDPSQDEESRISSGIIEQLEDSFDVVLDPARMSIPRAAIDVPVERRDLEVLLHINRHGVNHRFSYAIQFRL